MNDNLFLIDLTNLIYRYHFAFMRNPLRTKNGTNTSAIFGTISFILDIIEQYEAKYLCAAYDVKGKTFRHDIFETYKSGREAAPDELIYQIPIIIDLLKNMGICTLGIKGLEADDIIGTIKQKFNSDYNKCFIITADKDMAQLLDERSVILYPKKENGIYPELAIKDIEEKLGISMDRILDYYALTGDKVDSIPGVPGIGPKTAQKIIGEVANLEDKELIKKHISNEKNRIKIIENIENIKLYRQLLTIKKDADIKIGIDDLFVKQAGNDHVLKTLNDLELYSIMNRLDKKEEKQMDIEDALESEDISDFENKGLLTVLSNDGRIELSDGIHWGIFDITDAIEICSRFKGDIITDSIKKNTFLLSKNDNVFDIGILRDVMQKDYSINKIIRDYFRNTLMLTKTAYYLQKAGRGFIEECRSDKNIDIYKTIELPIIPAIIEMEKNGIKVDRDFFVFKKEELKKKLERLEREIIDIAGVDFNLNSPKQLSEILYNKLGIEPLKKTKTGFSTDYSVLKKLSEHHFIAELLLNYRESSKLMNGFVEPILKLSEDSGYIHTTFEQSLAATGRFSSKNPNMQNIPPEIRKGFIPSDNDHEFYSVDYSQIELRVLAFLSEDEMLLKAFKDGRDIHNETAMNIFDIKENEITPEMRSISKIINFSVIYGKTPFGLAQELNIRKNEAAEFIDKYFSDYKGVSQWIEDAVKDASEKGYSETLFNRVRYIPEINSRNKTIKAQAERVAVNTPIQGTAADIIKIAIKNVYNHLKETHSEIKMILTIHDELLFEIPVKTEENKLAEIESIMKDIEPIDKLLDIKSSRGHNWYECK